MARHGDAPHVYWSLAALLSAAFALLSLVPAPAAQLAAALFFGPARCLQWACYFQFLADARRYPPELTGRALGYNNVAIGLVADALPSFLTYLVSSPGWGGSKEGRYTAIKLGCLLLLALSAAFPLLLFRERHRHRAPPTRAISSRSADDAEMRSFWGMER